jgi:hypothetical protein
MKARADSHSEAVSHTQPYVLGFVGENENGILRWWTEKILTAFSFHGLSCKMIDLMQADWRTDLTTCLSVGKPEVCFSFQGMGMAMPMPSGENLWERLEAPSRKRLPRYSLRHVESQDGLNWTGIRESSWSQTVRPVRSALVVLS